MPEEEIERVLNYLADQGAANSMVDFGGIERKLIVTRELLLKMRESNQQMTRLLREGQEKGRLIDMRLALLRRLLGRTDN